MSFSRQGKETLIIAQSDQTVVNSITLANDSELTFDYEQNIIYEIESFITFNVANTTNGGMRMNWAATNSPHFCPRVKFFSMEDFAAQAQLAANLLVGGADITALEAVFDDIAVDYTWHSLGLFLDITSDGTLTFQFAQETAVVAPGGITRAGNTDSDSWLRAKALYGADEAL